MRSLSLIFWWALVKYYCTELTQTPGCIDQTCWFLTRVLSSVWDIITFLWRHSWNKIELNQDNISYTLWSLLFYGIRSISNYVEITLFYSSRNYTLEVSWLACPKPHRRFNGRAMIETHVFQFWSVCSSLGFFFYMHNSQVSIWNHEVKLKNHPLWKQGKWTGSPNPIFSPLIHWGKRNRMIYLSEKLIIIWVVCQLYAWNAEMYIISLNYLLLKISSKPSNSHISILQMIKLRFDITK